ncbi:hypothetical protein C0J52_05013 [Blattella germanica]|nr:hypothetical protein C0J52_05013 [Blattella germanica]
MIFTESGSILAAMGWMGLTKWRVKESLIISGIDPTLRCEIAYRFPTGLLGLQLRALCDRILGTIGQLLTEPIKTSRPPVTNLPRP